MVEFLFEMGMLKKTPRSGYQFLGSGKESVADHSFRTAVIGYALASLEREADLDRVIRMCLFHDFPEARTGDHNYVNKMYVKTDEKAALNDQLSGLHFKEDVMSLAEEFNSQTTLESRIARDADQLDMILELKELLDVGNPNARDWLDFAVQRLMTDNARRMAAEILASDSSNWWFDKKTDWWVNGSRNQV